MDNSAAAKGELEWHRVLSTDELPEGRVTTVHAGLKKERRACPLRREVQRAGQPLPASGRAAGRGLDRERAAALPLARIRLLPLDGQVTRLR